MVHRKIELSRKHFCVISLTVVYVTAVPLSLIHFQTETKTHHEDICNTRALTLTKPQHKVRHRYPNININVYGTGFLVVLLMFLHCTNIDCDHIRAL